MRESAIKLCCGSWSFRYFYCLRVCRFEYIEIEFRIALLICGFGIGGVIDFVDDMRDEGLGVWSQMCLIRGYRFSWDYQRNTTVWETKEKRNARRD